MRNVFSKHLGNGCKTNSIRNISGGNVMKKCTKIGTFASKYVSTVKEHIPTGSLLKIRKPLENAGIVAAGGGAAVGGNALATMVVATKTAGWFVFKKEVAVTAAEVVAGAIGVPTAAVSVGIPVVCAAGTMYAASKIVKYCNKRNKNR